MTKVWFPERIAELRRLHALEVPMRLAAAHLGVSLASLNKARKRLGLADRKRSAAISAARRRGVPRSDELKARLSAIAKGRWADPAYRAKIEPGFERGRAAVRAGKHALTRRGFPIPPEHDAAYRALVAKGLSSTEAAAALGFLPEGCAVRARAGAETAPLAPSRVAKIRTPKGVVGAVARHHGVRREDILSDSRAAHVVAARHHAIALVSERFPELSSPEVGRIFDRDHTSVLYARAAWAAIAHLHTIPFTRRILEAS